MNLAAVDLNLLKAADALLRELSVTRAADKTGVSQQAMSGQLKRLRDLFHDPLLVQRGRLLVPTPLGSALAQPVRNALMHVERALVTRPGFDPRLSERVFVIGTLSYVGSTLVPALLARLSMAAPLASVSLKPGDVRFQADLTENRIDIYIGNALWRANQAQLLPEVQAVHLYDDEFVCVGEESRFPGSILTMDDYLAAQHAVVDFGSSHLTSVDKAWIRHRLTPHVGFRLQSFTDVMFALPGTGLLGTVQRRLADRWAKTFGLSVFAAPFEIDPVRVEMLWHSRDEHDGALRFLRQEIVDAAASL